MALQSVTPLVVIVGPTASGKTALAIKVAQKFHGEIISADSRAIYKGMDIGTAKPTAEEQRLVPHWGIDLVEPGELFSAADFQRYAEQKITEIKTRGHVPFLVGGTGLYIDSILFHYKFGRPADVALRQKLETMSITQLQEYCIKNNIELPNNQHNKRYVIRAIEQKGINKQRSELLDNIIVVGITTEKDELKSRIAARSEHLFDSGVVDEAKMLGKKYGWQSEAMTGNIYRLVHEYEQGKMTIEELKRKFIIADWHLAKRQLTWLKRNPHIVWLSAAEAEHYLISKLASLV